MSYNHTGSPETMAYIKGLEIRIEELEDDNNEALVRISELERENAERKVIGDSALDLLAVMFDAYEYGVSCYEDPDDQAGYVGKAFMLTDEDFSRIADLLNQHRPRIDAAIAKIKEAS